MAEDNDLVSSAFSRFMKVSGLMGKVGASLLGQKTLSVFSSQESKEKRANDTWLKNADRIVQTLGELKGGVMKVGQMMSLQEGIFPPEFIQIISQININ